RIGPHEQSAPIVVTDFAQIPFSRQPLERIFEPPGHEENGDRLAVLALQLLRKVEKLGCRPNRGRLRAQLPVALSACRLRFEIARAARHIAEFVVINRFPVGKRRFINVEHDGGLVDARSAAATQALASLRTTLTWSS